MKFAVPALCAALGIGLAALPASAVTFGGLDSSRVGSLVALDSGTSLSDFRNTLTSEYPAASIITGPTVDSVASADVMVLGVVDGNFDSALTLSASEQSALLSYVQSGHGALIFVDGDNFVSDAPTANNSLIAPFGLHATGSLNGDVWSSTIRGPVIDGPAGTVWGVGNFYPGYFDALGNATSAAYFNGDPSQVNVAYLAPGALGAGSGPVVFFSDSTYANGTEGENPALMQNALAYVVSNIATPEPSTMAALAVAPLMLLKRRRR